MTHLPLSPLQAQGPLSPVEARKMPSPLVCHVSPVLHFIPQCEPFRVALFPGCPAYGSSFVFPYLFYNQAANFYRKGC